METEASNSLEQELAGLTMPSPPRRAGRVKSSRSVSFGGALSVQAGMSQEWMISSRGCSRCSLFGLFPTGR